MTMYTLTLNLKRKNLTKMTITVSLPVFGFFELFEEYRTRVSTDWFN